MPKKQLTPFQLELLQRGKDKARIKRDREVEQRIFKLAKENNKERKRLIKLAIYQKQVLREGNHSPDPIKFDNNSDPDSEAHFETSSKETIENCRKPFYYFEFILGLITGLLISLCISFADTIHDTRHTT